MMKGKTLHPERDALIGFPTHHGRLASAAALRGGFIDKSEYAKDLRTLQSGHAANHGSISQATEFWADISDHDDDDVLASAGEPSPLTECETDIPMMTMNKEATVFAPCNFDSPKCELFPDVGAQVSSWEALAMQHSNTIGLLTMQLQCFSFPTWGVLPVPSSLEPTLAAHRAGDDPFGSIDVLYEAVFGQIQDMHTKMDVMAARVETLESFVRALGQTVAVSKDVLYTLPTLLATLSSSSQCSSVNTMSSLLGAAIQRYDDMSLKKLEASVALGCFASCSHLWVGQPRSRKVVGRNGLSDGNWQCDGHS